VRLVTLGVGAQDSPRYAPAGLLVAHAGVRVMLDGGPGAAPRSPVDAWLVTDERSELIAAIRRMARGWGVVPYAGSFRKRGLVLVDRPVVHTSHPTCGYRIEAPGTTVVWAPEFYEFPRWARGAHVMFAEAAGWNRPIRFAGGVGGHLDVHAVARAARRHHVQRLVFAHIGRPTLRALERGLRPPSGEVATDGQVFVCRRRPARGERSVRDPPPRRRCRVREDGCIPTAPGHDRWEGAAMEQEKLVRIPAGEVTLSGDLVTPADARGIVLFAHGSGSSRLSPRNRHVAAMLREGGLATLLMDLLTREEETLDARTGHLRFDIPFLAGRLVAATDWVRAKTETRALPLGYFGASTGAAAALVAAAERPEAVRAIVSRGGRPDLAGPALTRVRVPTLLIVGSKDEPVIQMNRDALAELEAEATLEIVPGATHLFEEPGTLDEVARLARAWFERWLIGAGRAAASA
jgi:dienelactone hydrolase